MSPSRKRGSILFSRRNDGLREDGDVKSRFDAAHRPERGVEGPLRKQVPAECSSGRFRYVVFFVHAIKVLFDEFVIILGKVVAHSGVPILPDVGEQVGLRWR